MILYINTIKDESEKIGIRLEKNKRVLANEELAAKYAQAEKLLPAVEKLLKKNKIRLSDIKKIVVENRGGSFTAARIGVVTANALAYALGVKVAGMDNNEKRKGKINIVLPSYSGQPNITKKR
jgi:tRNA A37 threonylcarbamoyladenosine modification protein TsaB